MTGIHPLVQQLKFTRSEFERGLRGLSEEDGVKRLSPMNCISWNVGHMAWQEQRYFLFYAQGMMPYPEVQDQFASGAPASTPPLKDMLKVWGEVTKAADLWLESLAPEKLQEHVLNKDGAPTERTYGSLLQRMIYHYWYHSGENLAIRQMLGHTGLPEFVGDIDSQAPYLSEREYLQG